MEGCEQHSRLLNVKILKYRYQQRYSNAQYFFLCYDKTSARKAENFNEKVTDWYVMLCDFVMGHGSTLFYLELNKFEKDFPFS